MCSGRAASASPEIAERCGQPLGLGSVWRVDVVAVVERLEREVWKHAGQAHRHLAVVLRVTEAAERKNGPDAEAAKRLQVQLAGAERGRDGPKTGRAS